MSVYLDTENRGYPLPNQENFIDGDVQRIIDALNAIDVDMATVIAGLLNKAALSHGHAIADVTGLQTALDGKLGADASFAFSSLTGVDVAGALQNMFLRYDGSKWIPVAFDASMIASGTINTARLPSYLASSALSSAFSPLVHGHAISDVVGLQTALDGKAASSHTHSVAQISGLGSAATKNTGTGANDLVQLDANARLPAVDGRNLTNLTIPSKATLTVYNSGAGNFVLPNCEWVFVREWGGGGSGSADSEGGQYAGTQGGGGGAYKEKLWRRSDLGAVGATVYYSVGAGGAAVVKTGTGNADGNPGGNTTFGSLVAYGGGGGEAGCMGGGFFMGGNQSDSGWGGTNAASQNATSEWGGGAGGGMNGGTGNTGGNAIFGGAGGGGKLYNATSVNQPGVSVFGGNGGSVTYNGAGGPGGAPGGGGGSGMAGLPSGKGGDGRIEIYTW